VRGAASTPCLSGKLVDAAPTTPGVQASCTFVDHVESSQGLQIDTPLPACADDGNAVPCWKLTTSVTCTTGSLVQVNRVGTQPSSLTTTATCDVCQTGDARAGCAY
jgi:hypothetical protein